MVRGRIPQKPKGSTAPYRLAAVVAHYGARAEAEAFLKPKQVAKRKAVYAASVKRALPALDVRSRTYAGGASDGTGNVLRDSATALKLAPTRKREAPLSHDIPLELRGKRFVRRLTTLQQENYRKYSAKLDAAFNLALNGEE